MIKISKDLYSLDMVGRLMDYIVKEQTDIQGNKLFHLLV